MRIPIAHTLAWPERMTTPSPRLDLASLARLDFMAPDTERFPALRLARDALRAGGGAPAILNAANEIAVEAFMQRRIGFLDIAGTVAEVLDAMGDASGQYAGRGGGARCRRPPHRGAPDRGARRLRPLTEPKARQTMPAVLQSILAFLVVLGVLVFVHELGHYLAARLVRVHVEVFSIGFGPAIATWRDRVGTVWKLAWLPLGGYVKLHGHERPEVVVPRNRASRAVSAGDHALARTRPQPRSRGRSAWSRSRHQPLDPGSCVPREAGRRARARRRRRTDRQLPAGDGAVRRAVRHRRPAGHPAGGRRRAARQRRRARWHSGGRQDRVASRGRRSRASRTSSASSPRIPPRRCPSRSSAASDTLELPVLTDARESGGRKVGNAGHPRRPGGVSAAHPARGAGGRRDADLAGHLGDRRRAWRR